MTTYKNTQAALADPSSNLSRTVREARHAQAENAKTIEALMAQGMTREQAWLAAITPR